MKPKLALEMRPADTQEMQLICNCCGQPYYPNKAWEDRIRAIIFGAEDYAVCPLCTQAVPDDILHDEGYRQRCRYKVERLRELFEAENATHSQRRRSTSEPTYEELKARVAELEAQQQRGGGVTFKVSDEPNPLFVIKGYGKAAKAVNADADCASSLKRIRAS